MGGAHHGGTAGQSSGERRTQSVLVLTLVMMVAEVGAGWVFGSMALLADGWHMLTHAAAMGISVFAYRYARRHADNPAFTFGTGKVSALGGFASAVVLAVVAVLLAITSGQRLLEPVVIHFNEALVVTAVGLLVNLVSAWMLGGGGDHGHSPGGGIEIGHGHGHDHGHDHENGHAHEPATRRAEMAHDHSLRAAYVHVLADALTSVLALGALLGAKYGGVQWMDPAMGIVAAVVILRWSVGLLRDTSRVLLDAQRPEALHAAVKGAIEASGEHRVVNLKLWDVGGHRFAGMLWIQSHAPRPAAYYRALLPDELSIVELVVEIDSPS
jgi:cation diffusion facilitator family transporter